MRTQLGAWQSPIPRLHGLQPLEYFTLDHQTMFFLMFSLSLSLLRTDSEERYACSLYGYGSVGKWVPDLEPLTLMVPPTWYL